MSQHLCPSTGKVCYTKNDAKAAAAAARRRERWSLAKMCTYKCPAHEAHPDGAGLFHIGHNSRRRSKR